ncbi:OOP family OmpA-OmpF porin [Cricetibacter osteomyelitidis]|uniref:OOP family OmpA-OmpF porin n=1 Tax=Cricetibacter osteomyelitidis TaxID=1521931 RepID=A0A4R2SMQ1_9PAST|nr:OmpA family protein [Cricetibacter osteomyelitidis]TCP91317.1 OOP family OmpA-OmpF porin [Cricetibacter osteomyelitidis]
MKKKILLLSISLALTACSVPRGADQPLENWHNLEQASFSTNQLKENQALAVFYRQDNIHGASANVYVDGVYQTSLMPNAFSAVPVCANKHTFSTSFVNNAKFGNRTDGITPILATQTVSYYKLVQETNGRLSFVPVNEDVAKAEIATLPKQSNTLSRVITSDQCQPPVVLAVESLDTNALFKFDGYNANQIVADGLDRIHNFAQKVKEMEYVDNITVNGHTDPVGSESYNLKLSQRRAETVKNLLQQAGVSHPIKAMGYGKKELLVTNCSALKGQAKTKCNAPNRRVDIAVYGGKTVNQ